MNPIAVDPFAGHPQPPCVPSYLSESIFRIYEPHITRGVNRFPDETEFGRDLFFGKDDKPISGNTFVARFRDAIASVYRFQWTPTTIDMTKLWSISGKFQVAVDPTTGSVWFRPRLRNLRAPQYTEEARAAGLLNGGSGHHGSLPIPPVWTDWTEYELKCLCALIHKGRLSGPYILDGKVTPELRQEIESTMNVALTEDEGAGRVIVT